MKNHQGSGDLLHTHIEGNKGKSWTCTIKLQKIEIPCLNSQFDWPSNEMQTTDLIYYFFTGLVVIPDVNPSNNKWLTDLQDP